MDFESQLKDAVKDFNEDFGKLNSKNKHEEKEVAEKLGLRY